MESERIAKLTAAQKACLRLVLEHVETKEIARRLGISPVAVTERLRLARSVLGVSRSIDAARLLAAHESGPIRHVDTSSVVESDDPTLSVTTLAANEVRGISGSSRSVREDRASYLHEVPPDDVAQLKRPSPVPKPRGIRDDLRPWQVVCLCLLAGALAIFAFELMLKVDYELTLNEQRQ